EAENTLGEEFSRVRLPLKRGAFTGFPAGTVPARSGEVTGHVLPSLMARCAAKCFSTSIFLIMAMAAPVILLISSAAFIGSAEDGGLELAQASGRCVDRASNGFARYDQFHSRFSCRPAELSFEATGEVLPKPVALTEF